jgi:hypothetical protein
MTRDYVVGDAIESADIAGIHSCDISESGNELVLFYDLKNSDLTGVATYSPAAGMSPIRAH